MSSTTALPASNASAVVPGPSPESEQTAAACGLRVPCGSHSETGPTTAAGAGPAAGGEPALAGAPGRVEGLTESDVGLTESDVGLTESDVGNLNAVLEHEIARNTMDNYRIQWRIFTVWALRKGAQALPAEAAQVAAYLAERIEQHGHKPATLRVAAAAIAFAHRSAGLQDPCASLEVKRTLKGATRKAGRSQRQADALTAEAFALIRSSACRPRRGRGGRLESPRTAAGRGNVDVALIGLMRDGLLRASEAAALTWSDIQAERDGTGRMLIRRSKTDPEGHGTVAYVSAPTMAALGLIRDGAADAGSVFGLHRNQISTRIKQAARTAGLGDGFSGHSPRVGMARDLVRAGTELPSLMTAGRWRTPAMPAQYARNETAGRGAVSQFYRADRPTV